MVRTDGMEQAVLPWYFWGPRGPRREMGGDPGAARFCKVCVEKLPLRLVQAVLRSQKLSDQVKKSSKYI